MSQSSPANSGTVRLHRVLRAPAERIYRAFTDPDAMCRWLPPYGFLGKVHEADIREGGSCHMSFTNFGTGSSHSFRARYVELVEHELIRYTDQFDSDAMPEVMEVTVRLTPVSCGTDLHVVQANIPSQIPVEFCYLGWQESLAQLAHLVEPEIPDGM
jgi:uncharacterized protein YndB with AHSA1/START domain